MDYDYLCALFASRSFCKADIYVLRRDLMASALGETPSPRDNTRRKSHSLLEQLNVFFLNVWLGLRVVFDRAVPHGCWNLGGAECAFVHPKSGLHRSFVHLPFLSRLLQEPVQRPPPVASQPERPGVASLAAPVQHHSIGRRPSAKEVLACKPGQGHEAGKAPHHDMVTLIDEIVVSLLPHIVVPYPLAVAHRLEAREPGDLGQAALHGLLVPLAPDTEAVVVVVNQRLKENNGVIESPEEPHLVDVIVARQVIPRAKQFGTNRILRAPFGIGDGK